MKTTTQPKQTASVGIAALAVSLNDAGEIQLTPAGKFRGIDGRPKEVADWIMDAQAAQDVIKFCSARKTRFVLDYEHQSLLKGTNGQPAPAAGWFSGADLSFREGEGLFAKVELTARAKEYIDNGEYKYVSPVILYSKKTGRIVGLHSAGLTNTPNIDGMGELIAQAAASFSFNDETTAKESLSMEIDDLLEQLRWLLNLPTLATADEIIAELNKAVSAIKQNNADATAAANFSLVGLLDAKDAQIAALGAQTPDPAKYVPIDAMKELQIQVASLTATNRKREVDEVVSAALGNGQLLPAQEKWARDLGEKDMAALTSYLETAQPIAALGGTQTGGKTPKDVNKSSLTADELAMCSQLSLDPEDFLKTKQENAQA